MPKLTDLEPEWVADFDLVENSHRRGQDLTIANAQGVMFECPTCGRHSILVWFKDRGVPDSAEPGPGRWTVSGTGFSDLTLHPSINADKEHWHGWIKNGDVT